MIIILQFNYVQMMVTNANEEPRDLIGTREELTNENNNDTQESEFSGR